LPQRSATSPIAPPHLQFRIPPEPSHLLRARERLRDYLHQYCTERQVIDDVVLCVEEAATNAIRHSGSKQHIEISLGFAGGDLVAEVKDRGQGFDLASFDREALPDLLSDHGRGLFIVARLMDSLELSQDHGLEVRMTRRAAPRCEGSALESALGDIRTTAQLGQRDTRLLAMLEEIDEAFIAFDWDYRHIYLNETAVHMSGKTRTEMIDHTPWELWQGYEDSPAGVALHEAMELGKSSIVEHQSLATGNWQETRVYPTPAGVSIYAREINERKRIEQEIVATRSKLEATLAAITDGFYTLDRDWHVTYLNDKAAEVFPGGHDALGAGFWELFPEDVDSAFAAHKRGAMEQGEACSFEFYYPPTTAWFEERDYPSVDGITVLFSDITERKRAEAERDRLLETTTLLQEAGVAATSWADLDQMLGSLGDLLVRSTDHPRVLLELWDDELQEVEVAVSRGAGTTPSQRFEFDDVADAARQAITGKKTVVIDYAVSGLPGPLKRYLGQDAFLLVLAVPIVYRDRPIGVIMVDQPGVRRPFSPQEIQLVEAIAAQAAAAIESARLLKREAEAARFERSATWGRATRLVRWLRARPWGVLFAAIAVESAGLWALNTAHDTRHVLGVPGSMVALISVIAGALAGPLVGALVALAGGGVFYITVGGQGGRSSLLTTAISTAIWLAAGLLSGLLARGLREQTERHRAASVALVRADAAREAQLAEQSRIEELAVGLQGQTDALVERAELADALNAINDVVHSTLDSGDIMQRALAQGVTALHSDAGTIELWQEESWVVAYQHGFSGGDVGRRLRAEQAPIASRARATAQLAAIADLEAEPKLNLGFPQTHGLRAVLAVPLIVREEVIGCLLFHGYKPRPFTDAEVDFARKLGVTVSLALDIARLYLDQRRIAQTLQENFVHELPVVAGLEVGVVAKTAYEPELVGGDFSDVFVVDDRQIVLLIGDVAGKGVRAAGMTETVRSTVRALAAIDSAPDFILGKANELLLHFDPDESHVTAFLAVLDPHTGHLSYASAGHPAPVHLSAFTCGTLDVAFGPPLGTFERTYENAHAMLTLEDYLVLYTDGVTEARRDGELLGERRLLEIVEGLRGRSAQEVAEGVRDAAADFAKDRLHDDLQVVVLRLA
jgi:PAS domain S-box-containing protein